jgi:hypothetical protein
MIDPESDERRSHRAVLGATAAFLVLPLLVVRRPPLLDYPNHLARTYVLAHLDAPAFRGAYAAEWAPYPNLAMDAVVVPLQRLVGAETAARVFLVATALLFLFGADRLGRALHGRPAPSAPLAAYFFFNAMFLYGFLNFVFGVGLFFVAYAAWLDDRRAPSPARFAAAVLLGPACYLAHKTAFGFLGAAVLVHLARARAPLRALPRALAPIAAGGLIDRLGGVSAPYVEPARWDGLVGKARGFAMLFATYEPAVDAALALLLAAGVASAIRGGARPHRGAALVAAVLFALFVAFPSRLTSTWAVDRRFLLPAAAVALIALRLDLRVPRVRFGRDLVLAAAGARCVAVLAAWLHLGQAVEDQVTLLDALPEGSSVYGFALVERERKAAWTRSMGLVWAHAYAVVTRRARVNGLFALPDGQPLRDLAVAPIARAPARGVPPEEVDWATIFASYDHLLGSALDARYRAHLAARCKIVAERGDSALFGDCRAR